MHINSCIPERCFQCKILKEHTTFSRGKVLACVFNSTQMCRTDKIKFEHSNPLYFSISSQMNRYLKTHTVLRKCISDNYSNYFAHIFKVYNTLWWNYLLVENGLSLFSTNCKCCRSIAIEKSVLHDYVVWIISFYT